MAPVEYQRWPWPTSRSGLHTVNGVSALHSKLLTTDVFPDYHRVAP
jgi:glucan phosphorylase